jgi:fructose-bisphosphate aldolase, class I
MTRRKVMFRSDLASTAQQLVADSKGILAADESFSTIKKRFQKLEIESTPHKRRDYREVLFTTPGIEKFISGVILSMKPFVRPPMTGPFFPSCSSRKGSSPVLR